MFRPTIMAIFKAVLCEGYITYTSKPAEKYEILIFNYMVLKTLKYKIEITLFVTDLSE